MSVSLVMKGRIEKNKVLRLVFTLSAFILIAVLVIINPLYLVFFIVCFSATIITNNDKKERFIRFFIYLHIIAVFLLLFDLLVFRALYSEYIKVKAFFYSTIVFLLSFIPLALVEGYLKRIKAVSLRQKKYYNIPDKFPDLICDMHLVRTKEKSFFGYKIVHCKKSKKCFSLGRITHAKMLIGVIGNYQRSWKFGDEYSTMIWDNENKKIIDGDYDIIEIREGLQMQDYNAVVSKVVAFFYNQVKRSKPISEMLVRVAGNPSLSESTKRLLEERFLKVEYLELNYRKLNYAL